MGSRLELQSFLESVLGSRNVYFQPPESVKMKYPCVVYSCSGVDTIFANNYPYRHKKRYKVTVIDKNPDSDIPNKFARLQLCRFDRQYAVNNLNHFVFTLYF